MLTSQRRQVPRWMRRTAVATSVCFAAVTVLASAPPWAPVGAAHAAPAPSLKRRVVLFVTSKRKAQAEDAKVLQELMRSELARLKGVQMVGANGDPSQTIQALVGAQVEEGFRALNDRDGSAAEAAFRASYNQLQTYKGPLDKRLTARIAKGLGVALVLTGQVDEGEDLISASLNLWPAQQVGEYGWTLDSRTTFRDVERRRSETETGAIEVTTEPQGAAIRIGGEFKGFSPVVIDNLAAGRQWVEVVRDGYLRNAAFIDVLPGQTAIHIADLDEIPAKRTYDAAYNNLRRLVTTRAAAGPLANVRRLAPADSVIALQVSKSRGNYTLTGWVRDRDKVPQRISVTVSESGALIDELRAFIAGALDTELAVDTDFVPLDGPPQASVLSEGGDLVIDPNDPIFKKDEKAETTPITDEWWFWAIVGGSVVALTVGGIVLFSADEGGSGPSGNIVIDLH